MEGITEKEAAGNMEHLLMLLHKEWERSGRTKAEVSIGLADRKEIAARLAGEVNERQRRLEAGTDFRKCMELSKDNFVLLRMARKIKRAGDIAGRMESGDSFTVEMDGEEYGLFSALVKVWEA